MPLRGGKRKHFTIPRQLLQRRRAGALTLRALAEACGVCVCTVWRELRRLGLAGGSGQGRKPDQARRQRIAQLRAEGLTFAAIGRLLGVSRQAVHELLRRSGKNVRPRGIPCSECGREVTPRSGPSRVRQSAWCLACLARHPEATPGQRLKAYRLAAGLTQTELGDRAGVSGTRVGAYEQGYTRPNDLALARLLRVLRTGSGKGQAG